MIAGFRGFLPGLPRRRAAVRCLWTQTCAACVLLATPAGAGEITSFELESERDGYHLKAQGTIDAPREAVWRVLTDYAGLYRVSPRIVESELVAVSPDGVSHVRTRNRLCFLAFCRELRHLQHIRELGYGHFESQSVPEQSDLSRGYARWRLRDQEELTRLDIDFRFAMDSYSWVPSFVSRLVARSALRADAEELIAGIERAVALQDGRAGGR